MANPDAMNVLRRCAKCKSSGDDVCWSTRLELYVCDECYEELIPVVANEARDK